MSIPKDCLILVSGAEDKEADRESFFEIGILKQIIDQIPVSRKPLIEVISTATTEPDIDAGQPISVQNLNVHILAAGERYDTGRRAFLNPATAPTQIS